MSTMATGTGTLEQQFAGATRWAPKREGGELIVKLVYLTWPITVLGQSLEAALFGMDVLRRVSPEPAIHTKQSLETALQGDLHPQDRALMEVALGTHPDNQL